jgi:hypothetical protein
MTTLDVAVGDSNKRFEWTVDHVRRVLEVLDGFLNKLHTPIQQQKLCTARMHAAGVLVSVGTIPRQHWVDLVSDRKTNREQPLIVRHVASILS